MKQFLISILALSAVLTAGCAADEGKTKKKTGSVTEAQDVYIPKVIYGDDNRLDFYQVTDTRLQSLSDSTVALMRSSELTNVPGTTTYTYDPTTFEQSFALCKSEPFREQPSTAFCSGFLVGKNLVATAGHCIRSASDCSGTKFVFGFKLNAALTNPTEVDSSQIYSCSKIVHTVVEMAGKDFAIVELDREVTGHTPLSVRRSGSLAIGDGITVMGYPSGIPLKISGGANVRRLDKSYFVANLDTYGGNSGSAVFNTTTGQVEGILVRGETDFVSQGNCRVSKRCTNEECRGEDVTMIGEALAHIPEVVTPPAQPARMVFTSRALAAIPDNSSRGVVSTVIASEAPRGRKVKVSTDITHTRKSDLRMTLTSPSGRVVSLTNTAGMTKLSSEVNAGVWKLKVTDRAKRDTGILNAWSLVFE